MTIREEILSADQRLAGFIAMAATTVADNCHGLSREAGWWHDAEGQPLIDNPMIFPVKLMLTVSELAESMEGDRKGLADDHLPQYPMRLVELADAFIRIGDLAGAALDQLNYERAAKAMPPVDFGEIVAAKLKYNAERSDHKIENRAKVGGKKY